MDSEKTDVQGLSPEALLEHTAWMRGLARRLVQGADRVDDLVQDAWTAAVAKPPEAGIPLRAWLGRVLHNRARMGRRSDARRWNRESDAARDEGLPSVAELSERADQQRLLLEVLGELPEAYREVLLLRFFEDQTPAAIAKHLGLPVNTVRTRQQRGLERMREALDRRHAGDRSAWALGLLPLAAPARAVAGPLSVLLLKSLGAWIVTTPLKAAALTALLVVTGVGLWSLRPRPVPDLRRFTTPETAATEIFSTARTAIPPTPVERLTPAPASRLVRGRALDPEGRPIPGVELLPSSAPTPGAWTSVSRHEFAPFNVGWVRTDERGVFEGELAQDQKAPWLRAYHPEYLSLQYLHGTSVGEETVIRMAPLRTTNLEVEVVDGVSGQSVPRYRLMAGVRFPSGAEGGNASWSVLSHEELAFGGPLEVRCVEGQTLHLTLEVLGLGPDLDPRTIRREVTPSLDGTTRVRFELDLTGIERSASTPVAFGRVVDHVTNEPVPGVEITVHPRLEGTPGAGGGRFGAQRRRTQTFADGTFRIAMEEGGPDALLHAYHPHYRTVTGRFDGMSEAEVRLERRGALRGTVVGAQGEPLPGVPLLFLFDEEDEGIFTFEREESRRRVFTDDGGRFEFLHLPGRRYRLFVLSAPRDADENALLGASYDLAPGEQREVVLEVDSPERVRVHGRVHPPFGVTHGLVPVFLPYEGERGWTIGRPEGVGYTAGGLARGRYLVLLAPANDDFGGPYGILPDVEIDAFGEQSMDFHFPQGSLEGQVLVEGPTGDLLVVARPELPGGFAREFVSAPSAAETLGVPLDADGRFTVAHLPAGELVLELRRRDAPGEVVAGRRVTITGRTVLGPWRP